MADPVSGSILGSAVIGGAASRSASRTQAKAAQAGIDAQREMFERQVELQEPWRQAGVNALAKLQGAVDYTPFGMSQFQQDPGYAFRLAEGQKALERSAAARGGLLSGATGGALQQYGQNLASQEYQNAFNRYQAERAARLGPLQSLAGVGQTAAQTLGGQAGAYGANMANLLGSVGAARAAGNIGMANALAGGVSQYLNYQGQQNLLNALRTPQGFNYTPGGGGGYGYTYQDPNAVGPFMPPGG